MGKFISTKKARDITVVGFVFNEISLEQREQLKKELNALLEAGDNRFVLDLSRVGFLSSLVIATIVFFAKEARKSGGNVKLSRLSEEGFGIFKVTQLDRVFELYDTEHDAVESFKEA